MNSFIVRLPLILFICVSDSGAAPTSFSVVRHPFTRLPADNRAVPLSSSLLLNFTANRQYTRDLSNSREELQPIPNAFFPTYGIVLLVLFIIICALSSVLAIITIHSRTTREWISMVPGRVYARVTRRRQGSKIRKDSQSLQRGSSRGKNPCCSPSDTSPVNRDPSSPYTISAEPKNKPEATASEETVTTIPDALFSVSVHSPSPSGQMRSVVINPLSPRDPAHDRLSPPFSTILDCPMLLSASKRMFRFLISGLTSRSSTLHSPTPNIVTMEVSVPTPPESDVVISLPSAKTTDLDGANIMIVEGDVGCQSLALSPPPAVTPMRQSPLPQSDHSTTHSPTSTHSTTGFYSLSGDAQLSASTAFHSFIDLSMFTTPGDTVSDTLPSNPSNVKDTVISVLSPRYIHGIQLETIHEESDAHSTSLDLAPSAPVVRDCSPLGDTSVISFSEVEMDTLDKSRPDSTKFNEQMPSSQGELVHEASLPPRFFPAARSPPPPSEPLSNVVQVMSALRSPERQDKRRSVAWLQPVIDWAVDYPQDDCDCNPKANETLDSIPDMESDAECADALHAADAMAAVMDSLAAIGMDPTDMGLVTGEAISSTLCNSTFHSTSPSLPFADSEGCRASLHARVVEADLIEEQEVEDEIGASSNFPSQKFYHQSSPFSREAHRTTPLHNRSAYQDQKQGESIKTALISLLSPSSSRISTGEIQFDAQGNVPTCPAGGSQIGRQTTLRDTGRNNSENISAGIQQIHGDSKTDAARARSPTTSRPVTRTPRNVQPGRVYASPSSLAGLSPLEVAKKFSNTSVSSAGSTPSPSGTHTALPQHRPSSVSPMQLRRKRGISNSPSLDCTVSTMSSFSRHDPVSPSPHSPTPISHRQPWQQHTSELGCTKSTPMLSLRHDAGFLTQCTSSPTSLLQRQKPQAASGLARPGPILNERTNSMEFEPV